MDKSIPKPAIAALVAVLVLGLVLAFAKLNGGPAPTVAPSALPDYSKMSPEEIGKATANHEAESNPTKKP